MKPLDQPENNLSKDTKEIFLLMSEQANRMKDLINDLLLFRILKQVLIKNRSEKNSILKLSENIKLSTNKLNKKEHQIKFNIDRKLNIYGPKK